MPIPAEWSLSEIDLPPGASAKFPILWRGRPAEGFVVNTGGRYSAYLNRCAHAGTPLDWWPNEFFSEDGRHLVCATHGAIYDPDTGACAGGPCGGGALHRLPVRVSAGRVVVTAPEAGARDVR